jgi:hypothetical protein
VNNQRELENRSLCEKLLTDRGFTQVEFNLLFKRDIPIWSFTSNEGRGWVGRQDRAKDAWWIQLLYPRQSLTFIQNQVEVKEILEDKKK